MSHLRQHIFNKNSVSRGGVVDKHVSDSANELAVQNDRAARHTLNDTARFVYERGIGHLYGEALV